MSVNHVAIILDGNRRFAKSQGLPTFKGHQKGAETVEQLLDWAKELGVKELTLYSFSMQNFNRSKEEFGYLMNLFESFFTKAMKRLEKSKEVRFNFIGRLSGFPKNVQVLAKNLMVKSKKNTQFTVNFAFGYGGREEIVDAVNALLKKKVKKVTEKTIAEHLYLNSEPEIVIRTGGEHRTSNFLPWQTVYSEWFFVKKPWPAFTKNDFKKIIKQFETRERRFGK
ncbi:MAG TPA: polyprenyl diphosphate synthase [Candidatus Nanoarchaeia archaeon]|nr:polyprenyl diphosphate synthase [Candidatus Nanoarchaeia archaeon]